MSLGAAVVSVLATALQYLTQQTDLTYWPDLTVRLAKTFIASVVGTIGADAFDVFEFDWQRALDIAALATLAALAKGLLARGNSGDGGNSRSTPSTLPTTSYLLAVKRQA